MHPHRTRVHLLCFFLPSLLLVGASAVGQENLVTAAWPVERVEAGRLAERACSSCHSLRRVLDAGHVGAAWRPVVARMQRKSKGAISAPDAAVIAGVLGWWSSGARAPAAADPSSGFPDGLDPVLAPPGRSHVLARRTVSATTPPGTLLRMEEFAFEVVAVSIRSGPERSARVLLRAGEREVEARRIEKGPGVVEFRAAELRRIPVRSGSVVHRIFVTSQREDAVLPPGDLEIALVAVEETKEEDVGTPIPPLPPAKGSPGAAGSGERGSSLRRPETGAEREGEEEEEAGEGRRGRGRGRGRSGSGGGH